MAGQRSLADTFARPRGRQMPDYTSRRIKLRLFTVLAAIMLVAGFVERTFTRGKHPQAAREEPFSNRLANEPRTLHDPAGTFIAEADSKAHAAADASGTVDLVERATDQGWRQIFSRLTTEERDSLFRLIDAATGAESLSAQEQDAANDLLARLGRLWDEYEATARGSLDGVSEAGQGALLAVLDQAASRFRHAVEPLRAVAAGRRMDRGEEGNVAELDFRLTAVARGQIQDDTPILRPAERPIWLHEFARLAHGAVAQARQAQPTPVGYLQLSRQPADYRGELVKIKGNVRRAYRSA